MKFNELKRKAFFWVEKLQISRAERIGVVLLLVIVVVLFTSGLFLKQTFNFKQQKYDQIMAEFEKRSAALQQEEKQIAEKYIPESTVSNTGARAQVPEEITTSDESDSEAEPEEVAPKIVNINTATEQFLQSLEGIGPVYAKRIVEYRNTNGPFTSTDDLIKVKGIGEKRLEAIRPFITLKD